MDVLRCAGRRLLVSALSQQKVPARYAKQASFVKPKKSYGQNFLKDNHVSASIVGAANLKPGDKVLEIGPGTGVLTAELLKLDISLTAIENDFRLMDGLQTKFQQEIESGKMSVVQGDATRMDLPGFLADSLQPNTKWKVVANLPFNITTEILKLLLPMGALISDVFVMLQVEAAQRLCGVLPGKEDYRAMSVSVEFYSQATLSLRINRSSFTPQPHIDCQMVNFRLKDESERLPVPSEREFLQLVKICFSSRRKTVRNNLKAVYPDQSVLEALDKAGVERNVRPQDLSANEFAALTRLLSPDNSLQ